MVEETMKFLNVMGRLAFYWACFLFCLTFWVLAFRGCSNLLGGN